MPWVKSRASRQFALGLWPNVDRRSRAARATLNPSPPALACATNRGARQTSISTAKSINRASSTTRIINGLSLGQLMIPDKLSDQLDDHRQDGHTTTDTCTRHRPRSSIRGGSATIGASTKVTGKNVPSTSTPPGGPRPATTNGSRVSSRGMPGSCHSTARKPSCRTVFSNSPARTRATSGARTCAPAWACAGNGGSTTTSTTLIART